MKYKSLKFEWSERKDEGIGSLSLSSGNERVERPQENVAEVPKNLSDAKGTRCVCKGQIGGQGQERE